MADNDPDAEGPELRKLKLLRIHVTIMSHKASRFAHKAEVPGHAAYFGFLAFGFHEAYIYAAGVMFILVLLAAMPQGRV